MSCRVMGKFSQNYRQALDEFQVVDKCSMSCRVMGKFSQNYRQALDELSIILDELSSYGQILTKLSTSSHRDYR